MAGKGAVAGRGAQHLIARVVEQVGVRRAVWSVKLTAKLAARDAKKAVMKDALRRGETRTPKEILDAMEKETARVLTHSDKAAIKDFAARAAQVEKSLTPRIKKIAGDRLRGLPTRLKTERSLARKVATEIQDSRGKKSVNSVLGSIKDSVRYTMQLPQKDYARAAESAIARMKDAGFEPVGNLKNFWGNEGGYRGINSVWRDPQTGHMFEMQFHTEASLVAKEGTHQIYDFQRLPGLDSQVGETLSALQDRVFAQVPRPPNSPRVTWGD